MPLLLFLLCWQHLPAQTTDWLWQQVDACDALESADPARALAVADAALAAVKSPVSGGAANEPLLYLHVARGWHLARQGRIWQSAQAYEAARTLFETWQYADFEAVEGLYKPLGNHYTRLGDNEKALAIFQKALALGGDHETLAGLLNNMGLALWNAHQLPAAAQQLDRRLALSGLSAAKRSLLQGSRALVWLDAGQPRAAAQTAQTALALLPKGAEQAALRARLQRTLGQARLAENNFQAARQALEAALRAAPPGRDRAKTLVALAECQTKMGNAATALATANAALSAVMPAFQPKNPLEQPDAALFYAENTLVEALSVKAQAAQQHYAQTGDLAWLELAAQCYQLANEAEQRLRAVLWYESSKLDLQAATRRRDERALGVLWELWQKTGAAHYREAAFVVSEHSKAALLGDALRDNLVRQRLAGDPRLAQLAALRQNTADLRRRLLLETTDPQAPDWRLALDDLSTQATQLQRQLAQTDPALVRALDSNAPAAADFNTGLATDEALLEYFVSPEWLYIFVVKNGAVQDWQRRPHDDDLRQQATRWRTFFADPNAILADPSGYFQCAFQLHQHLWPSTTAQLPTATANWVVVPDGWLCQVPFEALLSAAPTRQTTLKNAPYLIQNQNIRYAWSLATLQQQTQLQAPAGQRQMLALAPGFAAGERGLSPLAATDQEWQTATGWQPDVLRGAAANRATFLSDAARYRVLHLATHALADATPRIELADQSLWLPEVYGLSLQADLVVLSACESGLGAEQAGEGVMSLSRAFAQAGAATLVGTLWSVNDRASADLCGKFYQQLVEQQTISAALCAAKRAYLSSKDVPATRQSPYFWAGLVQVGADRVVAPAGGWSWWWGVGIVAAALIGVYFKIARRGLTGHGFERIRHGFSRIFHLKRVKNPF